jgi:hypothetical protein
MNSMYVDWSNEDISWNWDFTGAELLYNRELEKLSQCPHGNIEQGYCHECESYPDDTYQNNKPMMNYAYSLFCEPDEGKIIKVCKETACTVVYNSQDDSHYLSLTGCGMDFSQSIALAYIIIDGCIEWSMLEDVYVSGPLSVSEEDFQIILNEMERQFRISIDNQTQKLKKVIKQQKKY